MLGGGGGKYMIVHPMLGGGAQISPNFWQMKIQKFPTTGTPCMMIFEWSLLTLGYGLYPPNLLTNQSNWVNQPMVFISPPVTFPNRISHPCDHFPDVQHQLFSFWQFPKCKFHLKIYQQHCGSILNGQRSASIYISLHCVLQVHDLPDFLQSMKMNLWKLLQHQYKHMLNTYNTFNLLIIHFPYKIENIDLFFRFVYTVEAQTHFLFRCINLFICLRNPFVVFTSWLKQVQIPCVYRSWAHSILWTK